MKTGGTEQSESRSGRPVLVVVDENAGGLRVVERELVQRYAHDYRIESLGSSDEALSLLTELADTGEEVALVLAGLDSALLDHVRRLHPHARRAVLVSADDWSDERQVAAVSGLIALGRVDYYVLRPEGSPDEVFHEAVTSFLLEWARDRRRVPQVVHIVGEQWSGRSFELRDVFARCAAPHSFCLADSDEGRALMSQASPDAKLPVMFLPDGRILSDPSNAEIAEAAGAPARFEDDDFDVVIVGAGPAGLSAAVYGASEGLKTLVVDEGGIGGQATTSSSIRNYLGFAKGISGSRLAEQAHQQALVFGARFVFMHGAAALDRFEDGLQLTLGDGRRIKARAVIVATGASYRRLAIPTLEALTGAGVFYGGPVSEAPALVGKDVYVAGGGNSAGQAALHLARYARRVTLLVRGRSLGAAMSHYLVQAVDAAPNVDVRLGTTVAGGGGAGRLEHLVLRTVATGQEETVDADGLFVFIGARPRTEWLPPEVARDAHGFLLTGEDIPDGYEWPLERRPLSFETSVPGVFAAGDVRHGSVKRVASAVGAGAIAIQLVQGLFADAWLQADAPARKAA